MELMVQGLGLDLLTSRKRHAGKTDRPSTKCNIAVEANLYVYISMFHMCTTQSDVRRSFVQAFVDTFTS